jgi:hypothetical protein
MHVYPIHLGAELQRVQCCRLCRAQTLSSTSKYRSVCHSHPSSEVLTVIFAGQGCLVLIQILVAIVDIHVHVPVRSVAKACVSIQ